MRNVDHENDGAIVQASGHNVAKRERYQSLIDQYCVENGQVDYLLLSLQDRVVRKLGKEARRWSRFGAADIKPTQCFVDLPAYPENQGLTGTDEKV